MTVKCTCRMYGLPVNSVMSNILHKGLIQPGDTSDIQVAIKHLFARRRSYVHS